ncbi:class I SAM-dependent methyltransferase [Streptomyces sp. NPDC049555]|uniref:class I SAM-dependent methyltransferase n=1 Tax=Streptomyces sp. NPDC049555 TaxID=3154930 RepID=UPI0034243DB3
MRQIIAVDPDPGMLKEGRELAAERGIANIDWRLGDSHHLDELHLGPLHVVTLGQALLDRTRRPSCPPWTNSLRPTGLSSWSAGRLPAPSSRPPARPPAWLEVVAEVRTRYLGPERRAGSGTYSHPKESDQDVLARSPFSRIEVAHWDRTVTRDLDSVIGLQFSYSYSSPDQLGDNKDAFEEEPASRTNRVQPRGCLRRTRTHRGHHRYATALTTGAAA